MFDFIGWTELFVIAVVAIVVMGPRELTEFMRTIGKTMGQLRRTADEFRKQFDDALKETELDKVKSQFEETTAQIQNPMTEFEKSVKGDLDEIERTFREGEDDSGKKSVAARAQEAAEAHAEHTEGHAQQTEPSEPSDLEGADDTATDNVTPLHKQAS